MALVEEVGDQASIEGAAIYAPISSFQSRPDPQERAGIEDFDEWVATFGETISAIEVALDGSGFGPEAHFAKFINVPEPEAGVPSG